MLYARIAICPPLNSYIYAQHYFVIKYVNVVEMFMFANEIGFKHWNTL